MGSLALEVRVVEEREGEEEKCNGEMLGFLERLEAAEVR